MHMFIANPARKLSRKLTIHILLVNTQRPTVMNMSCRLGKWNKNPDPTNRLKAIVLSQKIKQMLKIFKFILLRLHIHIEATSHITFNLPSILMDMK